MYLLDALNKVGYADCLVSDGEFEKLEQCTRIRTPRALTYLENTKYADALQHPDISCVICTPEAREAVPAHIQGIAVTASPKLVFFKIHNFLVEQREKRPTVIDPSAKISPQAYIAPYNVTIGKNVEIQPFVSVFENTVICEDVRICAGTVIGGQSFTNAKDGTGGAFLVRDAGSTEIRRGVEICSNCHVACGTLENDVTLLGEYTKLDAMVHIGHGTVVGKRTLFPAGAMISGNCVIGDDVWVGVNATTSNRITIGDRARVSLGSVVTKDVPAGETVTGNFAIEHRRFLQNLKESIKE